LTGLLEQARLDWSVGTFLILSFGVALATAAFAFVVTSSPILAGMAGAGGAWLPYLYVALRRRRRFKQFEEELPEAIDLLTRAIRAGHPLSSGMQMVADEGPPEVASEFRRTFEEQRFGIPFDEALMGMVDRTDMVDVRIFAIAVLVQREVGGNLAEILSNLAHTIRRRFYLRRQLRVYTAQGRMTGYALVALPIAVGFILYLIQPDYIMTLFENLVGWLLVGTAVFLQAVGGLWIRKIIDIEM
jgi:tight adherence protein B